VSPNLTSDSTGLGDWTDEEIEAALRIGINRDGRRLYPLMPYANFYNWSEADMQALIMYLRTVPPVENEVIQTGPSGEGIAPELTVNIDELPQLPPDGSDQVELGRYLVTYIMSCGDCHTPLDPETGMPLVPDMFLAGGQAYEGPWGIVYGGNITPHETGLAEWEAEDYIRVFREGVRIDGRRVVFMPWQDYTSITDEDLDAVIAYLQSLDPIDNEIPAPALEDIFIEFVEDEE
jgi:mono/diheme cytochrome c family protein